jgi:hypothetical protein
MNRKRKGREGQKKIFGVSKPRNPSPTFPPFLFLFPSEG